MVWEGVHREVPSYPDPPPFRRGTCGTATVQARVSGRHLHGKSQSNHASEMLFCRPLRGLLSVYVNVPPPEGVPEGGGWGSFAAYRRLGTLVKVSPNVVNELLGSDLRSSMMHRRGMSKVFRDLTVAAPNSAWRMRKPKVRPLRSRWLMCLRVTVRSTSCTYVRCRKDTAHFFRPWAFGEPRCRGGRRALRHVHRRGLFPQRTTTIGSRE